MKHFALDASVLVKRYHNEPGSEVVQKLTDSLLDTEPRCALVSWPTLAETLAGLNRKRNAGAVSESIYQAIRTRLLLEAREMNILSVTDTMIRDSLRLIEDHNINASDALFLHQVLNWKTELPESHSVVMVAADRRLLRAAKVERLAALDPEQDDAAAIEPLLAPAPDEPA